MIAKYKLPLQCLLLPLLVAVYPILFLYAHNAWALEPAVLLMPIGLALLVASAAFGLFLVTQRRLAAASLSAVVFMVFYHVYGTVFTWLLKKDWFPVQHFQLLPLAIALALYCGAFLIFVKPAPAAWIQKIFFGVAVVLTGYNLVVILSVQAQKIMLDPSGTPVVHASVQAQKQHPDIYYIILDEYAGFDAVREWWQADYVNQFEDFLNQNQFFLAPDSRSVTINTGTEMASRLNFQQYPENFDQGTVQNAINNNKLMQVVKSYGYTTVSINMPFQDIHADVRIRFNSQQIGGLADDEFKQTVISDSMLAAFEPFLNRTDQSAEQQRDIILYSLDKTASLKEIQSPKLVYTHILLPHRPFIFDENGNLLDAVHRNDWNYYLGQHKYATRLAEDLITKLLKNADPQNPPVIILQSDHGARNLARRTNDNIIVDGYLANYDMKYSHYILNALYLPGFDTAQLAPNLSPLESITLVLNHYLGADVSVLPPLTVPAK